MNIGKVKISPGQLMGLIIGYMLGSSLFTGYMDIIAKQDAWIVIVISFITSAPFFLSYIYLAKRFPGKTLIQMNDIVYGSYLGKLISVLYAAFILDIFAMNISALADFYAVSIMPEMPKLILMILFTLVGAYAVKKGIETIARISWFAVAYSAVFVTISCLLLIGNMDFGNFLPVFQLSAKDYVQSTHIFSSIPFCNTVLFLMVFPALNDVKKIGKYSLGGFAVAGLILFIVSIRNTSVLGPSATIFTNAAYEATRLINIGEVLTRVELFIALAITLVIFVKSCVMYYATVKSIGELFRVRSVSSLIIPAGIIAVIIAMVLFRSSAATDDYFSKYHPFFTIPFEFILPPLTLLIAKIRRLPGRTGGESA
ncbi:MAG: GerAB/ArcD/ProY family transporter [Bacillota bacterium]